MSIGLLFWVLFLVALVLGFVLAPADDRWGGVRGNLLWWVLIGLLGWGVFGAPIKG